MYRRYQKMGDLSREDSLLTDTEKYGSGIYMEKNFDNWNEYKKGLHGKQFPYFVHVREVWWCSLGLNVGHEEDGKNENFERPVLVLKKISNDLVVIVPLSTKMKVGTYYYPYAFEKVDGIALLMQVRVISTKRFLRKMTRIQTVVFKDIVEKFRNLF